MAIGFNIGSDVDYINDPDLIRKLEDLENQKEFLKNRIKEQDKALDKWRKDCEKLQKQINDLNKEVYYYMERMGPGFAPYR